MNCLTKRQAEVLRAIWSLAIENGFPPTVRELAAAIKVSSPNGVFGHLKALERKGKIFRARNAARAIKLLVTA